MDAGRFFLQQTVKPNSDTLTILGGKKGSPASYRGTVDADGNVLTGSWVYPGGGEYDSTPDAQAVTVMGGAGVIARMAS